MSLDSNDAEKKIWMNWQSQKSPITYQSPVKINQNHWKGHLHSMAESKVTSIKAMVQLRHIDAPLAGLHRSWEQSINKGRKITI